MSPLLRQTTGEGGASPDACVSAAGPYGVQRSLAANRSQLIIAAALVGFGLLGFSAQLRGLWDLWNADPLRQIGLLVPPVSLWLALRNWSWHDWERGGTWWGFALLTAALALGLLFALLPSSMSFALSPALVTVNLVPRGILLCAYLSGAVLFLGGVQAWRKAAFALLLWLFVNPVPGGFTELFDLPAQALAARVARGFAQLIAVPVDGNALKMMFSPELGIFIAPGCDGLRGATTMGYMALVIGYLYRMKPVRIGLFVLAAVALAYIFNFLRLCAVICYYWFALRIPVLGNYGTSIDYLIGGVLFVLAACFLRFVPQYYARGQHAG